MNFVPSAYLVDFRADRMYWPRHHAALYQMPFFMLKDGSLYESANDSVADGDTEESDTPA